jgi:hypothetical protein
LLHKILSLFLSPSNPVLFPINASIHAPHSGPWPTRAPVLPPLHFGDLCNHLFHRSFSGSAAKFSFLRSFVTLNTFHPALTPFSGFAFFLSVLYCHCSPQVEMQSTKATLEAMRREMRPLLETAIEGVLTKARGVLEEAEQQRA